MDVLERKFNVKSLPNFVMQRSFSLEDAAFIQKFAFFKVATTQSMKVPDSNVSTEVIISWGDMCCKTEQYFLRKFIFLNEDKNNPFTLNSILQDKEWAKLHSIIGTTLMDFILTKAILLRFSVENNIYFVINRDYHSYRDELSNSLVKRSLPKSVSSESVANRNSIVPALSKTASNGDVKTKTNLTVAKPCNRGFFLSLNSILYSESNNICWSKKSFLFSKKPPKILKELFKVKDHHDLKISAIEEDDPRLDDLKTLMSNVVLLHRMGLPEKIVRKFHIFDVKKSVTAIRREKRQRKAIKLKPFTSREAGAKFLKKKLQGLKQTPKKKVLAVLAKLIRKIYYQLLCGSKTNFAILKKKLRFFLNLGKIQYVSVDYFINDFRLGDISWLRGFPCITVKKFLFSRVFYWFFHRGILKFLKINFHVTEIDNSKTFLAFFDKFSWIFMKKIFRMYLVRSKKFQQVSRKNGRTIRESAPVKTVAKFRFTPKGTGVRPLIIARNRPSPEEENTLNLYKDVLNQLLLNITNLPKGELLDCLNLYYKKLENPGANKFFVRVDIFDAFGSILQDKLIEIIKRGLDSLNLTKSLYLHEVCTVVLNDNNTFSCRKRNVINFIRVKAPRNSINIFSKQAATVRIKVPEMLDFLERFIKKQVFTEGSFYFHQIIGVPQSHKLSAVFSDLYYNDLTGEHLKRFIKEENFLYRVTDDFIFISPNQRDAEEFYNMASGSFPDYNCSINRKKIQTNLPRSGSSAILHFFGFSIDVCSTAITVDYSSFNKMNTLSSITLPRWEHRVTKMVEYHFRDLYICANLFYKLTLKYKFNSLKTTQINFYEAAVMVATKFRILVDTLLSHKNDRYLVQVVLRIVALFENHNKDLRKFKKFSLAQNVVRATVIVGFTKYLHEFPSWHQVCLELYFIYQETYQKLSLIERNHLHAFHFSL
nr:PREDICTED: telomerase reverse transcriptase-like [Bemisia tabaci]XP_018912498.1 PREDICTED: telomerase reverse transcriptase-like [Bemisia tabaci]XP_018912500.1 PREDICTED: telomerase reverse transcriptase-like [Bemisia tabaci]XP_018912501.1 PREDICTED: telomerase reverse transcriptase-like [Bemisia tabaci]